LVAEKKDTQPTPKFGRYARYQKRKNSRQINAVIGAGNRSGKGTITDWSMGQRENQNARVLKKEGPADSGSMGWGLPPSVVDNNENTVV